VKKALSILLLLCTIVFFSSCGSAKKADNPPPVGPVSTGTNVENPASTDSIDAVIKNISVTVKVTKEKDLCVFIKNNNAMVIDELELQVKYYDKDGNIVDVEDDGHDMVLPGYTVVSKLDAPKTYEKYESVVSVELGSHPKYENHSKLVDVKSNKGENNIIVQITNNDKVTIEEAEFVVVLYQGSDVSYVSYSKDVYDIDAGKTVTEKVSTYNHKFDRYEVYLNQAHTFGL